jgi:LEA14-like dessication related protein
MGRMIHPVLVGVLTLALLAGCGSTEEYLQLRKPTVRLANVQFREADAYGATLVFDVEIQNHYSVALPLVSFDYSLASRGQEFLVGSSELAISVPAGGSRTVSLPARVDYLKALRALSGIEPGMAIPYDARLDLIINTPQLGRIMLPMGKSGDLVLPDVADIDLQGIRDILTKPT